MFYKQISNLKSKRGKIKQKITLLDIKRQLCDWNNKMVPFEVMYVLSL